MFGNHLKIILRNIFKHKAYSMTNVLGLAVGMAVCILIMLWVQYELSYDRFHDNADRLYRVVREYNRKGELNQSAITPAPLGLAAKSELPEISLSSRYDYEEGQLILRGERRYADNVGGLIDPDFLEMFSFSFIRGNPRLALDQNNSVILSASLARKIFGEADPMGETININRRDFVITGIISDPPPNSHLRFDFLCPFASRPEWLQNLTSDWGVSAYYNYFLLEPDAYPADVNHKLTALLARHNVNREEHPALRLQPLAQIHLNHQVKDYLPGHGDIKYVYIFSALALMILVIACINYMNLATAMAGKRAKEIGLRKVVGAGRISLIRQFLGESMIITALSSVLAIILVEVFLPFYQQWAGKTLHLNYLNGVYLLAGLAAVLTLTGILAGCYPALALSSLKPMQIFRNQISGGRGGSMFRKILVVIQFVLSIFMIVGTVVIARQLEFISKKDLGFDKEQLLYFVMQGKVRDNYEILKSELERDPSILAVSAGTAPTDMFNGIGNPSWDGKGEDEKVNFCGVAVDYDYIQTMRMEILEGRGFSRDHVSDETSGFVINEIAAACLGPGSPVGRRFTFSSIGPRGNLIEREGAIIGVIRDFHFMSLHDKIMPLVMYIEPDEFYEMCVRIDKERLPSALGLIRQKWITLAPEYHFDYYFLDQTLNGLYRSEQQMGGIFKAFTGLAILISCLGLFGLITFMVERRIKEIGIRKVLGATIFGVMRLLSKESLVLVTIAYLISAPIAYLIMNRWLQGFTYRAGISLWLFILAGLAATLVAALTVSIQAARAALANPVDSLRHE